MTRMSKSWLTHQQPQAQLSNPLSETFGAREVAEFRLFFFKFWKADITHSPAESEEASYKLINTFLYQNMNIHTNLISGQSTQLREGAQSSQAGGIWHHLVHFPPRDF